MSVLFYFFSAAQPIHNMLTSSITGSQPATNESTSHKIIKFRYHYVRGATECQFQNAISHMIDRQHRRRPTTKLPELPDPFLIRPLRDSLELGIVEGQLWNRQKLICSSPVSALPQQIIKLLG